MFVVQDEVLLCNPGYPGASSVDQASLKHRALPASASGVLKVTAHTPLCGCCGNLEPSALRYLRSSSTWGTPAPSLHCLLSMPGWCCVSVNIRCGAHKVPWAKPDSLAHPLSGHPPRKIQKAQGCLVSLRVGRLAREEALPIQPSPIVVWKKQCQVPGLLELAGASGR